MNSDPFLLHLPIKYEYPHYFVSNKDNIREKYERGGVKHNSKIIELVPLYNWNVDEVISVYTKPFKKNIPFYYDEKSRILNLDILSLKEIIKTQKVETICIKFNSKTLMRNKVINEILEQ